MVSGLTRNQVPGNRLRVRIPCPPLIVSLADKELPMIRHRKLFRFVVPHGSGVLPKMLPWLRTQLASPDVVASRSWPIARRPRRRSPDRRSTSWSFRSTDVASAAVASPASPAMPSACRTSGGGHERWQTFRRLIDQHVGQFADVRNDAASSGRSHLLSSAKPLQLEYTATPPSAGDVSREYSAKSGVIGKQPILPALLCFGVDSKSRTTTTKIDGKRCLHVPRQTATTRLSRSPDSHRPVKMVSPSVRIMGRTLCRLSSIVGKLNRGDRPTTH